MCENPIEGMGRDGAGYFEYSGLRCCRTDKENVKLLRFSCVDADLNIPEGITEIDPYAFEYSKIRSVKFPDSLRSVGNLAFYKCSNLVQIEFGKGPLKIANDAFGSCSALETLDLKGVTEIGASAFSCCFNLRDVKLHDVLTRVGYNAFICCYKLKKISLPASVKKLDMCCFDNVNEIFIEGDYIPDGFIGCASDRSEVPGLTVHMGGRTIIFPKNIVSIYRENAEAFLKNFEAGTNNIPAPYGLAWHREDEQNIALDGYFLQPTNAAKVFLQKSFHEMMLRRSREEDCFILFSKFRDGDLLTKEMDEKILAVARENNWMQLIACVLEDLDKHSKNDSKSKRSAFSL